MTVLVFLWSAFAGGLLLNLMPCVFPMLAVKMLSLGRQAGENPRTVRLAGLAYTAGVLLSFAGLLAVLQGLRAAGRPLGWGFQLQNPAFVVVLLCVFFVMTLGLAGFVNLSVPGRYLPAGLTARSGVVGDFFAGLLAVFVASPCTAPLMAPALGFALAQPFSVALGVFLALGLGFAFPFLLLSLFPHLARALPKPGAWMETFKQVLLFPLIATQIWFVWLFAKLTGIDAAAWLLASLLAAGFVLWALGRTRSSPAFRAAAAIVGCVSLAFAVSQARSKPEMAWQPFSPAAVSSLRASNKTVFVDFTADWCVTCKVNEKSVLDSTRVVEFLKGRAADVALLRADWTNEDETITRELELFGRAGVPLYLVYVPGELKPRVLPQILTVDTVLAAFDPAAPAVGTE